MHSEDFIFLQVKPKLNIYDEAFFTLVRPYFKSKLNLIELSLGSIFYTTHPFAKKLITENFGRKSLLLTMKYCSFLLKFEIMRWNGIITKE